MAGWCCPGMFSAPFGDLLDSSQLDYFFLMLMCCFILLGGMFPPLFEKILESVLQAARIFKTWFFHYFFSQKSEGKAQSWESRIILQQVFFAL